MQELRGMPVVKQIAADAALQVEELKKKGIEPKLAVVRVGEREDDLSYERGLLKRFDTTFYQLCFLKSLRCHELRAYRIELRFYQIRLSFCYLCRRKLTNRIQALKRQYISCQAPLTDLS